MVRIRFYDPDSEPDPRQQPARTGPPPTATELVARGPGIDWIGQLGWRENPFIPFPARPAQRYLIGHDAARKAVSDFIARGEHVAAVTGVLGIGKTIFLAWLAEELASRDRDYRVVQASAREPSRDITARLVAPYRGLFGGYGGETPAELAEYLAAKERKRRIVLLLDDADALGENESLITALLDSPRVSIVLAAEHAPHLPVTPLAIPLTTVTALHAEEILEARIRGVGGQGLRPFTSRVVAELWKSAQGDLTRFFRYAEETAMRVSTGQLDLADLDTDDSDDDADPADADDDDGRDSDNAARKGKGSGSIKGSGTKKRPSRSTRRDNEPSDDDTPDPGVERAKRKRDDLDALIKGLVDEDRER